MGMQVRLVLYAEAEAEAHGVATAAFAEIARLDAMLSNYRRDSEISALAGDEAGPRPVSPEVLEVLARAQRLAELSGGAFDVTAGPLTELWRGAIERRELPDSAAIASARARTGYRRLQLDVEAGLVIVAPGTELDVGGIAKGFVLDRALAVIAGEGIGAALVEAGGDLVVGAAPPGSEGWSIDVPHLGCRIELSHAALATSGDEFQFVEIDGVRYSHTVDPRTELGLRDSRTVSVVASDGLTADGLATTLTILTEKEGETILSAFPGARLLAAPPGAILAMSQEDARSRADLTCFAGSVAVARKPG
jgi:thiamine biosynthesis lipoprotein